MPILYSFIQFESMGLFHPVASAGLSIFDYEIAQKIKQHMIWILVIFIKAANPSSFRAIAIQNRIPMMIHSLQT